MNDIKTDVVVAGAGLVGSAVALGVADLGYKVLLLEPGGISTDTPRIASNLSEFGLRVSALTRASTGLLCQLGIWPLVEKAAQPYRQMDVWDRRGNGRIVFDADEIYQQDLGVIIENHHVLAALHGILASSDSITAARDRIKRWLPQAEGAELTTESGQVIQCQLFLGVDGASSVSRKLLALPTREWDYGQEAMVATVQTSRPHHRVALQRFLASGPLALLPLKDVNSSEHFCSLVWSLDDDALPQYKDLSDAEFMAALSEASDYKLGDIQAVSQRLSFPLRQLHAKEYTAHHSAIIGDAAHTIHPLAGQGVNLGFADVAVLLEELKRARTKALNPGDAEVLLRYQRRRQSANLLMMTAMEGFKRGFASESKVLTWMRNQGLRQVNRALPLKRMLIKKAMGL